MNRQNDNAFAAIVLTAIAVSESRSHSRQRIQRRRFPMNRQNDNAFAAIVLTAIALGGFFLMRNQRWSIPSQGLPFAPIIGAAEYAYSLPSYLLARLLHQESRFNPNARNPRSNAIGIAQFVLRWHPDMTEADALNPEIAIPRAARYLRGHFNRFGTWERALAAYNWGQGNLKNLFDLFTKYGDGMGWREAVNSFNWTDDDKARLLSLPATSNPATWITYLPKETRDYVTEIVADVPQAATRTGIA